ncbi:MAG: ion transporter [Phycisphaerales bacterium]|jgi:voltage-gated sodium channel|nr:ion transporter [Phycisphaerales bacterium]
MSNPPSRGLAGGRPPIWSVPGARRVVEAPWFGTIVIATILINAALIGWSTYEPARWITLAERVCIGFFVVELLLRFRAAGSLRAYFADPWNVFDFILVATALIPTSVLGSSAGELLPLLRILRVFRVLRLIKAIPELRLIVTVLTRSVVSMKYIGLLAAILFYVYGVIGVKLFGAPTSPLHAEYATLHEAMFTLFRVLTGDAWTDLRYKGDLLGWSVTAFHVSWIVLSTFILINLIVGAIVNNYQAVQDIEHAKHLDASDARLEELLSEVQAILKKRKA